MDTILVYVYNLYKKVKQWYYEKCSVQCFMIAEDGEQIPIFTNTDKRIIGFLTEYNKNNEIQYKFNNNFKLCDFDIPEYKILSIAFNSNQTQHSLDPKEFSIVGNILFTPLFNTWLCRKLNIHSITNVCIIDDNANIQNIQTIEFGKYKYIKT